MLVPTKAIVLRSFRYSEADLIAKCYTASDGLKSYMLKGILKAKRGKLKAAMFQPFTELEVIARHKNKGTLEYLQEARIINSNSNIGSQVEKTSIALFLAEVIQNAVQEEEQNEALFQFLERSIQWLENHDKMANFHLLFLVQFTKYLGFYPHLNTVNAYFNLQQGHFEAQETDRYSIGGPNCELLKKLMEIDASQLQELKLNQGDRYGFLNFILSYYQIQLQGFRQPKSLEILNQLFS